MMKLVPHWKVLWRAWSARISAIGAAFFLWLSVDPVTMLYVWSLMPPPIDELIPAQLMTAIGAALFALSMGSQFFSQKKIREKANEQTDQEA